MSEDEVERFEITDYDLENEFGFKRTKISKNERIYGIWAENESSGDEEASSRRPSFRGSKKPKNYTAPIGFVAGGIQQSGKKPENEKKDESDDSNNDEDRDDSGIKSSKMRIKNSSSDESDNDAPRMNSFMPNYDKHFGHGKLTITF